METAILGSGLNQPDSERRPGCSESGKSMMDGDIEILKRIYDRFNSRDIDGVLAVLADDVAWANGMDGGHVHGRSAGMTYNDYRHIVLGL